MSTKKGIKEQYSHLLIALNGGSIWQELDGGSLPHRPTSQRKKEMSTEKQSVIVNGVEVKHPVERYMRHKYTRTVVACSPSDITIGTVVEQGGSLREKGYYSDEWTWTEHPRSWKDVTAEWRMKERKSATEKKYTTAPFNLEAFKNGAPAVTLDGRKALFVAYANIESVVQRLIVVIDGEHTLRHYNDDGRALRSRRSSLADNDNLFMLVEEKAMKTVVIYSNFEDLPKYFVVDGNYSHLDNIVVNNCTNQKLEEELIRLLFDETYMFKQKPRLSFPKFEIRNEVVEFITVGWAP